MRMLHWKQSLDTAMVHSLWKLQMLPRFPAMLSSLVEQLQKRLLSAAATLSPLQILKRYMKISLNQSTAAILNRKKTRLTHLHMRQQRDHMLRLRLNVLKYLFLYSREQTANMIQPRHSAMQVQILKSS